MHRVNPCNVERRDLNMRKKKGFLAIILAMLMVFGAVTPVFAAHWADSALQHYEKLGVLTGSYNPDSPASRELVCRMIDTELGSPQATGNEKHFPDLSNSPYSIQIGVVANILGMVGYPPNGTFKPNNPITRGEVATMLGNKNSLTPVTPVTFVDAIPDWCRDGVSKAANVGLVVGYPDRTFRAGRSITIAEAATIVSKWRLLIDQGIINAPAIPTPPPVADPVAPEAPTIPTPPPVANPVTPEAPPIPAPPPVVTVPSNPGPGAIPPPVVDSVPDNSGPGSIPSPGGSLLIVDPNQPGPGEIPPPPPVVVTDPVNPGPGAIPEPGGSLLIVDPNQPGPGAIPDPN